MSEGEVHAGVLGTLLCLCALLPTCFTQILTPPSFNLAKGREITATATCGVGVPSAELYCHLTGTEGGQRDETSIQIQGQLCDYCDPANPWKNHSATHAIDGTEKFWQSPPLSRGDEYNEVDLEIPLGQEFFIAYIFMKMGKAPRPGVWALEKSSDFGETWEPWQYFADTDSDCNRFFQTKANQRLKTDDQILCVTDFSKIVPLTDGEILVSLTNGRPNAYNFSHADDLKEFMRATNVRIRLLRTRTLLGHLIGVANQDPTVTRRYFYSIRDISIGGRCVCNGHADTCSYLDPARPNFLVCDCQHNTVGDQCERCDEANGFVQKKWQPARVNTPFMCERCQCFGRATECVYDAEVDENKESLDIHGFKNGGGVCQNCAFNTTGNNCEKCVPGYFRAFGVPFAELYMCQECQCDPQFHINECEEETGRCLCKEGYQGFNCGECSVGYYGYPDCIPCDCDVNGTEGSICHVGGGQCPCKERYVGAKCDMCTLGYYSFPDCMLCECDPVGSMDQYCNVDSGQCKCELNYASLNCSTCANGYFNHPDCALCTCDPYGTEEEVCDKTSGECLCLETFSGEQCDSCARGYYAYPDCMPCMCQEPGSTSNICEDRTGQCTCRGNYGGQNCEHCAPGFYKYPDCVPCNCDGYGALGESCDQETGQCDCRFNFQGLMCDKCKEGLYNYPNCEECNCNPAGARQIPGYPLGGCGEVAVGLLCECKAKVTSRICDTCFPGYWNLNRNNPDGCEACACSDAGTIAGMNMCNMITGQCMCKVDVTGRNCDSCQDGYYSLHKQNLFGCIECDCDIGGSESLVCNKETGQCPCKPRVQGRRCDQSIQQHFIPNLDQLKFEIEDGYTPEGHPVRYGFDERLFPNFSWRGYAILTPLQNEVRVDIDVYKPSIYRVVYRYVNLNEETVTGNVTWTMGDTASEPVQTGMVKFASSEDPAFSSVSGVGGNFGYVLNPGRWTMAVKTDENVFLDYMILIPQAYFEATVLQTQVFRPCQTPDDAGPCLHYSYPETLDFPRVEGDSGYVLDVDGNRMPVNTMTNNSVLFELGIDSMAVLTDDQQSFYMNLYIPKTDKYVLVLNYYSTANTTQNLLFDIGNDTQATAVIYTCQYSSLCRQVLLGLDEMEGVFELDEGYHTIKVTGQDGINAAIESIVAVPYHIWTIRYIRPSIVCIRINGVCVGSRYSTPIGSVRIDFESLPNDHLISKVLPPSLPPDSDIGFVLLNSTQNLIVLLGNAREPGVHKFLVHYYLPYDTGSEIPVVMYANGQEYKGVFRPRFCPTTNGCRDLIYFEESGQTGNINLLNTDVKIEFNNTSGQDIWLDYMLLIPAGQYNPNNIVLQPVDNSRNFIDVCLDDGYMIKQPITDFCEKSLFTLTTEFNNGALECECNIDGSLNFNCDPYGGQCTCRPNVIGRTCSACRVGYYGFPRCQPCNCPFGLCHQLTGQCICPPRVTGDRCDVCEPGTYGYDALIGCQECKCNAQGVVGGDINCDEDSGECSCQAGIGGRKCDYCLAGFYAFPLCRECDCDRYGTTEDICDVNSAQCMCKENVMGARCDECMPFTYNIDPENPKGCTSCFCFGATAKCQGSTLSWDTVTDMSGWSMTNMVGEDVREAANLVALIDAVGKTANTSQLMYWVAPDAYLGNKVTSYGGYLTYEVLFSLSRNDSVETEALEGPDVILVGNGGQRLAHRSSRQPYNSAFTEMEVQLIEYNFVHADSGFPGTPVDRETFMTVLVNLEALHIAGSYYSVVEDLRLKEVELDSASDMGAGQLAVSVEQCVCPRGYTGSSCENCAGGYYRARSYPYLGVCQPCECNGHADSCDLNTGECLNCQNNTMGAHCEMCLPGYMGSGYLNLDTTAGCSICGCPLRVDSNNFADTCSMRWRGNSSFVYCDCQEGYTGRQCERCSPGYYGDPMTEGSSCARCECSNNIDMTDPDSCDYQTGSCQKCINNSTGIRCERCRDWWYGDALETKDCYPCSCSKCGSMSCDTKQGQCTCQPNVMGVNCDRCAPDTYGFDQCNGCRVCECAEASVDSQCDMYNGSCLCQPGVTGHKCDSCINGFWNYMETGCDRCDCDYDGAVTCDPLTGRCQCLPGVTGAQCDTCLDRWVLVPQEGCQECDECSHYLMDDVEYMDGNITVVQAGLQTVSIGVYAMQRLDKANESIAMYQPMVNALLYESDNITLDPVAKALDTYSTIVNNVLGRTTASVGNADGTVENAMALKEKSAGAVELGEMSDMKAKDAILYIKDILRQINEGIRVTNIETYINLVEQSMANIQASNFTMQNSSVYEEMEEAKMMLMQVQEDQMSPKEQMMTAETTASTLDAVSSRLNDLVENSQNSEAVAYEASAKLKKLREETLVSIESHVGGIEISEEMTVGSNEDSEVILDDAQSNMNDSTREFKLLDQTLASMVQSKAIMNEFGKRYIDLERAGVAVNDSWDHAAQLQDQADLLENVYTDTRDVAANAVDAGTAYENIVFALENARAAAEEAVMASNMAKLQSGGVGDISKNMTMSSEMLLTGAMSSYNRTKVGLGWRLTSAKAGTDNMADMNKDVAKARGSLDMSMKRLPVGYAGNQSVAVMDKSKMSVAEAELAIGGVQGILADLPEELEKTGPLATKVINFSKDISLASTQVNNVQKSIPEITKLLTDVQGQSEKVQGLGRQVTTNLAALREKIAIARNQANLIRVGLKFLGNTTATLRNPAYVAQAGSYNKVSLFFKTTTENGLLLYAGSPRSGTGQPNQDYMAIELENGNVVFKYNLGNGLAKLNHPHYVADGKWYKVTAQRIGKAGTLSLDRDPTELPKLEPVHGRASGLSSVLEMHPLTTRFYVGGIPVGTSISDDVTTLKYEGVMESVEFDDTPMGLWNFEAADNNYVGARERSILTSIFSNGFRFDGSGYVILSTAATNWKPAVKSQVTLKMKTYAEDGLLFYAGDGKRDFLSIEVNNGQILFQYDLGGGRAELRSTAVVNDGEWHDIRVSRLNKTGIMNVDEEQVGPIDTPGSLSQLSITDDISVGGYPHIILPTTGVTKQGFEGCIEDVTLQLITWDLNNNKQSKGVIPGCPEQIARVATFSASQLSYVAKPMDSIGANFDLTFKMKTKKNTTLMLFAGHTDQPIGFSVSVVNGMVAVVSNTGEEKLELMSRVNTYNDGRWHYISIMKMGLKLMMNIDDYEIVQGEATGSQKKLETNTPLYFGTPNMPVQAGATPVTDIFDGCIGDVTINGEFLNFASIPSSARPGSSLSGCPIPDPEGPYERETIVTQYPPFEWPSTTTTEMPAMDTCAMTATMPGEVAQEDLKGLYFGAYPNSRIEFSSLPGSLRIRSAISLDFRTTEANGMMFYVADRKDVDHISVVMQDGNIRYTFNSGTGMGTITSTDSYNDGEWHMLEIGRNLKEGSMQIDGELIGTTKSAGRARSINVRAPYYFGGVNASDLSSVGKKNIDGVLESFKGCLANIKLNGADVGEPLVNDGTIPCSDLTEAGAYFYDNGGFIQLMDSFRVGQNLEVQLEVRPRSMDGVLFAVHGSKGDFVLLQIVEGALQFRADNGDGPIIANYVPDMKNKLCDGMWHKIIATKNRNVVILQLDDQEPIETTSSGTASSTDTANPFYLGGKPDAITKGIRAKSSYLGCLRNVYINGQPQFLTGGVAFADVSMENCPVN